MAKTRKKKQTVSERARSPEYRTWSDMRSRCNNPRHQNYKFYGARGIRVCERWNIFENFLADMGSRPGLGYSIDRIDVNGNYEPGNCRWATKSEQARNTRQNRRIEYRGRSYILSDLAHFTGIPSGTLARRLDAGWKIEDATQKRQKRIIKLTSNDVQEIRQRLNRGELQQILAGEFGVSQQHISRIMLKQKWRALTVGEEQNVQ